MYFRGDGVIRDQKKGCELLRASAKYGYEYAGSVYNDMCKLSKNKTMNPIDDNTTAKSNKRFEDEIAKLSKNNKELQDELKRQQNELNRWQNEELENKLKSLEREFNMLKALES